MYLMMTKYGMYLMMTKYIIDIIMYVHDMKWLYL